MDEYSSKNGTSKEGQIATPRQAKEQSSDDLEVRSTEVQEIIGRPPHWLVRGGIAGFLGVLALIFTAASVIKYPEAITAPLRLTAINAPKTVESEMNGKLVKLLVNNGKNVKKGEIVAWVESTADHATVQKLSTKVDSMYSWLERDKHQEIRKVNINKISRLGGLQTSFQTFSKVYTEFLAFLPGGFYSRKRKMLKKEIAYKRELLKKLKNQKEIQKVDLNLARQKYEAQKKLAEQELSAPLDLASAKTEMSSSRLPLLQTETAIINNREARMAKKKQLMELNKQVATQYATFRQALNTLQSAIHEWKNKFFVTAPISGRFVYSGVLQENQTVTSGQNLAYVQPENTSFSGEMMISQRSYGKIEEGQRVLVRFSGYPSKEFGSITAEVDYLSDFPVKDSVFVAKVDFPNGFTTNYEQEITPTDGMRGQAEIITQDMRFVERIYNNLTKELR